MSQQVSPGDELAQCLSYGWAPVGQTWAPNGPRMGLTGAHLGMLLIDSNHCGLHL